MVVGVCGRGRRETDKGSHGAGGCGLIGFDEGGQEGGVAYDIVGSVSAVAGHRVLVLKVSKHEAGGWWGYALRDGGKVFKDRALYAVNKAEVMRHRGHETGGFFGWDAALSSKGDGAGFEHGPEVGGLGEAGGVVIASMKHCRGDWRRE